MLFAVKCMADFANTNRYTSRTYAYFKPLIAIEISKQNSGPNLKMRKPRSKEAITILKQAFANSPKHKAAARKNFQLAAQKKRGILRPEHLKKQWSLKKTGVPMSDAAKQNMKKAANLRKLKRACCLTCHKELPVNSLGSHWRFCKINI